MILEDERKTICHYNENVNLPDVERVGIGSEMYMTNKAEVYDKVGHNNLRADLVKHIFNVQMNPVVDDFVEYDLFDNPENESEMFEEDSTKKCYERKHISDNFKKKQIYKSEKIEQRKKIEVIL